MVSFFVPGVPIPKGSAKAFVVKGRAVVTQDNGEKQKPWAAMIAAAAQDHFPKPLEGPVMISVAFRMPRLKGHFGTGKNAGVVKATVPVYHTVKPDLDKLLRCVKDALTTIAWRDDSQVAVVAHLSKRYDVRPGAMIKICEIGEGMNAKPS